MKFKDFNFILGFRHFFRGLTPLKLKNFDQILNISDNTQNFTNSLSGEFLINTSLHHTMKFKDFNFFLGFRHFFSRANTFKTQEFRQKFEYFQQHSNFSHSSSLEFLINTSLHHTTKFKDFNFFLMSPFFSWAKTFKTQEFRQKFEYFQQHSKFCTWFIQRMFN